jgi:hypothetical protein
VNIVGGSRTVVRPGSLIASGRDERRKRSMGGRGLRIRGDGHTDEGKWRRRSATADGVYMCQGYKARRIKL